MCLRVCVLQNHDKQQKCVYVHDEIKIWTRSVCVCYRIITQSRGVCVCVCVSYRIMIRNRSVCVYVRDAE